VWRIVVAGILFAIGVWLAIDALITTDSERVEAEIERLLEVARRGGDDAADEILDAFAEDYHGAGLYSPERIRDYARRYVAGERPEELWLGNFKAFPKEDGTILVPILRIHVKTRNFEGDAIVKVTFAERDERFRIVNVEPALGR